MGGRHPRRVIGCGLAGEHREVCGDGRGRGVLPRTDVVEGDAVAPEAREHRLGHPRLRDAGHEEVIAQAAADFDIMEAETARLAGCSRRTVYNFLKKLGRGSR